MSVCAKCGFENDANVKICANCLTNLRWAKVNLGKFHGNANDTKRIGIESRKERGISVPENNSELLEPIPEVAISISDLRRNEASSLWFGIGCLVLGILAVFPYMVFASWYTSQWRWLSDFVFHSFGLGDIVFFSGFFLGFPFGIAGIIIGVQSLRRSIKKKTMLIAAIGITLSIAGIYGHYWFFATCQFCQ